VILAILVAGVAAAVFAVGISLQHRAAGSAGQAGASTKRWLMELARRPSWLVGIGLSAVGFGLHSAALALGSVALVQPIVVSATVFAVLIRAWLDRQLPALAEVGWATCTWAGLALFLSVTTFRSGQPMADGDVAGILLAGGVAVAAACALGGWRTKSPVRRGVLWGAAAGVLFGLVAGLLKIVITQVQGGALNIADHWPVWALLVTGGSGLLLNQRAYRAARLSVSMPVLNLIDVLVALLFATTVFGERLFNTPATVTAQLVALAAIGAGIWRLARHQECPADPRRVNPHLARATTRSPVPS
jgi:hypothetical protein